MWIPTNYRSKSASKDGEFKFRRKKKSSPYKGLKVLATAFRGWSTTKIKKMA
jgi:hypothetical protein